MELRLPRKKVRSISSPYIWSFTSPGLPFSHLYWHIASTFEITAQALETVLRSLGYQFTTHRSQLVHGMWTLWNAILPVDWSRPCKFYLFKSWCMYIYTSLTTTHRHFYMFLSRNLSSMGLTGRLPPEIGKFSSLELLDLSRYNNSLGPYNLVKGPLPDEFGNLAQLKYL